VDGAVRDVDLDPVAALDQPDQPAFRRFRRQMADRQAGRPAGEAPVGDQGADLSETLRLQVAGWIQHLLHPGPAARPFVAYQHNIAGHYLAAEDALHRRILALEDLSRPGEDQDRAVDARSLHDAAVEREVAVEHRKAAILREGMRLVADDPTGAIGIQAFPAHVLAEGDGGRDAARRCLEEVAHLVVGRPLHVPTRQRFGQRRCVDAAAGRVEQPRAVELAQDSHDAAGPVHILDMHIGDRGRDLAEHRHPAGQPVDVLHGEIDVALMRRR
jgi:hypothetical protein